MALHFHKMDIAQDNQAGEKTVDQEAERAKGAKAEMDKALAREAGGKRKGPKAVGGTRNAEGAEEGSGSAPTPRGGGD